MKVTGVTIVRNAEKFGYPVLESIQSLLPLCDQFIVLVGNSDDATLELLQAIQAPKLRIEHSVWDDSLRAGGQVLATETNKVLDLVDSDTDWIFYIQADELIHEKDYTAIQKAMQKHLNNPKVEGLLFQYYHFWGNYNYLADSRKWYRKEIRIIRNRPEIRSYKDAQGFRKINMQKLWVKAIDAHIYHYGWVRPPDKQVQKRLNFNRFWHSDEWIKKHVQQSGGYDYRQIDSVRPFEGTHPALMKKRIAQIDWQFSPPPQKLSLKEQFSRKIERLTGYRIGEYKNYKILKS